MNTDYLFDRPFSSWTLEPSVGEPAYGFFARQVESEGHFSSRIYATEIGLNGRRLHPEELLESLLKLDLKPEFKERLRRSTPIGDSAVVRIGDNVLRGKQISYTVRRFCPVCLAESPVHRVWWDVVAFQQCPVHDVPLQSKTQLGETLGWWWSGLTVSPKGEDLTCRVPRAKTAAHPSLEAFIVQRISGIPCVEPDLLAGESLADVIDVVSAFTQLLMRRGGKRPCTVAEVFQSISRSRTDLLDMLKAWLVENFDPEERRKGFNHAFGKEMPFPPSAKKSTLYHQVVLTMREAVAQTGRFNRYSGRVLAHRTDQVSLSEMMSELGVSKVGVKNLANHLGLNVGRYSYFFDADARYRMHRAKDELITLSETMALTGLRPEEFSRIEAAGHIRSINNVCGKERAGKRYIGYEVEEVVQQALNGLKRCNVGGLVSLDTLAKQRGLRPSAIVSALLTGEIQAAALHADRTGFAGLYFEKHREKTATLRLPEHAPYRTEPSREQGVMTFAEVATTAGFFPGTVPTLVRCGLLEVIDPTLTRPLISRASFETFIYKYASAQIYLRLFGCLHNWVPQEVKKRGLTVAFHRAANEKTDTVVLRESAKRVLGYEVEPDSLSVGSTPLWEDFKDAVLRECPVFFVQRAFHNGEAKVRPAQNRVFLTARHTGDVEFTLEVKFSSKQGVKRWRSFQAAEAEIMEHAPWVQWEQSPTYGVTGALSVKGQDDIERAITFLHVLHRHFLT